MSAVCLTCHKTASSCTCGRNRGLLAVAFTAAVLAITACTAPADTSTPAPVVTPQETFLAEYHEATADYGAPDDAVVLAWADDLCGWARDNQITVVGAIATSEPTDDYPVEVVQDVVGSALTHNCDVPFVAVEGPR